jgi:hypothetical protein
MFPNIRLCIFIGTLSDAIDSCEEIFHFQSMQCKGIWAPHKSS